MKKVLLFAVALCSLASCNLFSPSEELIAEREARKSPTYMADLKEAHRLGITRRELVARRKEAEAAIWPAEAIANNEHTATMRSVYNTDSTITKVTRVEGEKILYQLDSVVTSRWGRGEVVFEYHYVHSSHVPQETAQ